MTQDPLVDELRKPEYASLDDQQAADAINAKTVTYRRPASSADVKAAAIRAAGPAWRARGPVPEVRPPLAWIVSRVRRSARRSGAGAAAVQMVPQRAADCRGDDRRADRADRGDAGRVAAFTERG